MNVTIYEESNWLFCLELKVNGIRKGINAHNHYMDDSELDIVDSNNRWTQYFSDSLYHWYVLLFFTIMYLNI